MSKPHVNPDRPTPAAVPSVPEPPVVTRPRCGLRRRVRTTAVLNDTGGVVTK